MLIVYSSIVYFENYPKFTLNEYSQASNQINLYEA